MQIKRLNLDTRNFSYLAFVTLLSGCNDMDGQLSLNSSKALATVNGDEISVNQFNLEMNKAHIDNTVDVRIKDKLLSKIIDRQLLAQEASKMNLDRAPEVVEAVNSAKAQIYAQAYLTNRTSRLAPPSDQEVTEYIDKHPEICAHRKVFSTKDIVFNYDAATMDLKLLQASVTDIESLVLNLESNKIKYGTITGRFSMDTLPPAWAEKLKTAHVGHLLYAHDDMKVIVKSITSITENPMSADEAKDYARRVLLENNKQTFVSNEVSRLRKLSKIRVLDDKMALASEVNSNPVDVPITEPSGKP